MKKKSLSPQDKAEREKLKAEKEAELFEKAPVRTAVARMAIPSVLGMVVVLIYNITDIFFIGMTHDTYQTAAVSVATPVFMLFMAFGSLLGIGGTAIISQSLGKGDRYKAQQVSSFCTYGCIVAGIILTAFMLLFMGPMLNFIGASENTFDLARDYLKYIAFGSPFVLFANAFSNIVRAEGAANQAMVGQIIGTVVNIILDPFMILDFGLGLGVAGAGIATVLGNIFSSIYYIWYILSSGSALSVNPKDFTVKNGVLAGVLSIGLPSAANNMLMSVSAVILNMLLVSYGDAALAAMGVASKGNMLLVLFLIGLSMGVQPLIGYCYGAKKVDRMKEIVKFTSICAVIMGAVLTVALIIFATPIISAFSIDEEVIKLGKYILIVMALPGPILGLLFMSISILQGIYKPLPSFILSLCRQGVVYLPSLFIFNYVWGLNGLFIAQPIADVITVAASLAVAIHYMNKLNKKFSN